MRRAWTLERHVPSASPSPPPRPSPPTRYNYPIQGFRGFAAGAVFWFHIFASHVIPSQSAWLPWPEFLAAAASLRYGVELFFMISGYVILGSLLRHPRLSTFFWDRAVRIYPAFVPVHVLVFLVGPFVGWGLFAHIGAATYVFDFFANLAFLPTVFPVPLAHWAAWTLSYEWVFYFFAAATLVLYRAVGRGTLIACLSGVAVLVALNYYPRALFFVPGVIANLKQEWLGRHAALFRFPSVALVVFLACWLMTGVDASEPSSQLVHWLFDGRIVLLAAAFAAGLYLICAVVLGQGGFSRMLSSRPLQFMGAISYSFYLWHPVVVVAMKRLVLNVVDPRAGALAGAFLFVVGSALLSILIAWLSWQLFEVRLSRWLKHRFARPGASALVA